MKILVTGGHGYLGTYICKSLSKAGHEIFSIDKEKANEEFGKLLTAQLKDNERRRANADNGDSKMLREVEELSRKNHEVQLKRTWPTPRIAKRLAPLPDTLKIVEVSA